MAPRKRARATQGSGAAKKRQKKKQHPESGEEEDPVAVTEYPATNM
jgi:hypothetical protein